jgi:hypothetical protein
MGHYDSSYDHEAEKAVKAERELAKAQLKLMNNFLDNLNSTVGSDGISERHLEHFEDMINETALRARIK